MTDSTIEVIAKYLTVIAESGKRPSPQVTIWARHVGLNVETVRQAKLTLIDQGRLKYIDSLKTNSIDGIPFLDIPKPDEVQQIKEYLMRYFRPVYDPHTVAFPTEVPRKQPTELMLGHMRVSWDDAVQLATYLSKAPDAL